jgi:ACR3 family arsenite transporter
MGVFERYLSVWIGLSIMFGVVLGLWRPDVFQTFANLEIAHVNIVVAVFI